MNIHASIHSRVLAAVALFVLAAAPVSLSFLVLFAGNVGADATAPTSPAKKYPPYPEVWGYEFPYPNQDRYYLFSLARMDNGDIYVTYGKKEAERNILNPIEVEGIGFFSGEKRGFTASQYNVFWDAHRKKEIGTGLPVLSRIVFKDGSSIQRAGSGGGGNCYDPFIHALAAYDKNGQRLARKGLVYLLSVPRKVAYSPRCPDAEGEVIERAQQANYLSLVELKDDTFLVYEQGGNFILRLDKVLNTKYSLNDRLFLIDWDVVDRMRQETLREAQGDIRIAAQKLNDAVYDYLMQLKQKGGKP